MLDGRPGIKAWCLTNQYERAKKPKVRNTEESRQIMKIYAGTRVSDTPGDVDVRVHKQVAFCPECHIEVESDTDNNYPHFDRTYHMCTAQIDKSDLKIVEEPLLKRTHREPSGFEWGTHNKIGSKNLALALLWDILDTRPSNDMVRDFSREVVEKFKHNDWSQSEYEISKWISHHRNPYSLVS